MPKSEPVCCEKLMRFIGRTSCSECLKCETIDWYYCERCKRQEPLFITGKKHEVEISVMFGADLER
jgi:hypothetical protein